MGMYALLFRQFVFWIRTKVFGEEATTLQRYLTTFVVMSWFKNQNGSLVMWIQSLLIRFLNR